VAYNDITVKQPLTPNPDGEHMIYSTRKGGGGVCAGTVAIPMLDRMPASSVMSLVGTDWTWLKPEYYVKGPLIIHGSSVLTLARNEAVQRLEGDWICFIDDDMVWQPDAVGRLIATREEYDLDMLGALCFRRSEPFQPTMYMRESADAGLYNYVESWDADIAEVDATGLAFAVIHKRVFEKIAGNPIPSLEDRMRTGPPEFFKWQGLLGEDLRFCQDAKAAGCHIFVDTRIKIGHVAEREITERDFLVELALRDKAVVKERRKANNRMGLSTVTPLQAFHRLKQ